MYYFVTYLFFTSAYSHLVICLPIIRQDGIACCVALFCFQVIILQTKKDKVWGTMEDYQRLCQYLSTCF